MGEGRSMKAASIFLGLPLATTVLVSLIRGTRHLAWEWPVHAHHHLIGNISTAVGLSLVGLMVLFGPMQRREKWAWWALLIAGAAIYGGFWLGNVVVGLGEPGAVPNTAQGVQTGLYLVGLILGWRAVAAPGPSPAGAEEQARH